MDAVTPQAEVDSSDRIGLGSRSADLAYPIVTIILILAIWELACHVFKIPAYLLPPPSSVLATIWRRSDILLDGSLVTSAEIVAGFILSIVVGIVIALLITSFSVIERSIYPLLVVSQAVPKVALAPLLVVWFGFGWGPKVLVVVLIAFFPVVVDLAAGIQSVPPAMKKLALSMGASRADTLRKFIIPHALPHFFAGLKVSITLAVSGAIIGEFVGADRGLGYLLLFANGQMDTTLLFASITLLATLGIAFFYLLMGIERLCMPWRRQLRGH